MWGGALIKLVQKAAAMRSLGPIVSQFSPLRLVGYARFGRFGVPLAFALIAAPEFIVVGLMVVRAEQDGATKTLIQATEAQHAGIARTLSNAHADTINYLLAFDVGDAPDILPMVLRRSGLAPLIEAAVRDTSVVNVKLYDGNGITLLSGDRAQLGEDVSACECFAHVLMTGTFSELISLDDSHHGPSSQSHSEAGTDILSTMIRLNVLTDNLVASDGVLEIQSDVTGLLEMIMETQRDTWVIVGIPLALLYALMVALVTFGQLTIVRRDRLAAKFATRATESEASDRAKSEFLSLMSHELRTPLNAIIGFSQLIGQKVARDQDEETVNYANTINDSGQHMLKMVSSILDMTALELGEFDMDHDVLHLEDVVRAAVLGVGSAFDKNLATLTVHTALGQAPVLGDREKLQQVFDSLLSNAARFTPAGGSVDVVFNTAPDGFVCVTIKDTGVGMTKE